VRVEWGAGIRAGRDLEAGLHCGGEALAMVLCACQRFLGDPWRDPACLAVRYDLMASQKCRDDVGAVVDHQLQGFIVEIVGVLNRVDPSTDGILDACVSNRMTRGAAA
jgi:hypothetical protein